MPQFAFLEDAVPWNSIDGSREASLRDDSSAEFEATLEAFGKLPYVVYIATGII